MNRVIYNMHRVLYNTIRRCKFPHLPLDMFTNLQTNLLIYLSDT